MLRVLGRVVGNGNVRSRHLARNSKFRVVWLGLQVISTGQLAQWYFVCALMALLRATRELWHITTFSPKSLNCIWIVCSKADRRASGPVAETEWCFKSQEVGQMVGKNF